MVKSRRQRGGIGERRPVKKRKVSIRLSKNSYIYKLLVVCYRQLEKYNLASYNTGQSKTIPIYLV